MSLALRCEAGGSPNARLSGPLFLGTELTPQPDQLPNRGFVSREQNLLNQQLMGAETQPNTRQSQGSPAEDREEGL